jgi:UDP-GlcNAc:undecaprenyl-phosphate GlcNAc-1-phosphate transferase
VSLVKPLLLASGVIVAFGFLDDLKNLGFRSKFIAQISAAVIVVVYGGVKIKTLGSLLPAGWLLPELIAVPLTVFVIVGVTNAINLADGLDGLAGGISLLSFLCIVYLGCKAGNPEIALIAAAMAGAIFGFLRFNTYPATVFMGDAGSQFLGFLAVSLAIGLTQETFYSPLLPLLLLGFPVLDTLTVMFERIYHGRPPFVADKNHFHHKLIRLGFSHTESVVAIYTMQTLLVAAAYWLRFDSDWLLLGGYLFFSGLVLAAFFTAGLGHWRLERTGLPDPFFKGKLRTLKERNILIKVSFRSVQVGLPILLLFACLLPESIPRWTGLVSLALAGIILVARLGEVPWRAIVLRGAVYLVAPLLIYLSHQGAGWQSGLWSVLNDLGYGLLVFFVILVVKYSRRAGYKSTPLDFLILFIALVVPNLPEVQKYQMGLVAAEIIALFFGYEVLLKEMRGQFNLIELMTAGMLIITGFRGIIE